jgi:predicted DNA-binding protein with PD1-like motif
MFSIRRVNPNGSRVFMGTLTDGAALHDSLAQIAEQHHITTASFNMLGALSEIEFAAYGFVDRTRMPPISFSRAMEIVSGHGTISLLDEKPHVHTHLAVAFRDEDAPNGIAVVAGHVNRALCFAVEFTLTAYDGAPIHRADHRATGLKLWDV